MKKSTIVWASCLTLVALIAFSLFFRSTLFGKTGNSNYENIKIVSVQPQQSKPKKYTEDKNVLDPPKNIHADPAQSGAEERHRLIESRVKTLLFKDDNSRRLVHIQCGEVSCQMFVPSSASVAERYMYVSAVFLAMSQGMLDSKLQSAGLMRDENSPISWEKGNLSASLKYSNNQ